MHVPGLRGPGEKVGGIVYFGRMLDKIRLDAAGRLPPGYNLGTEDWTFYDARCTRFLGVDYARFRERALLGGSDETCCAGVSRQDASQMKRRSTFGIHSWPRGDGAMRRVADSTKPSGTVDSRAKGHCDLVRSFNADEAKDAADLARGSRSSFSKQTPERIQLNYAKYVIDGRSLKQESYRPRNFRLFHRSPAGCCRTWGRTSNGSKVM